MGKMHLTETERDQLEAPMRSRTMRVAEVRRAKLILMLEDGASRDTMKDRLECDSWFISRGSGRFLNERLVGLYARHLGRVSRPPVAKLEARGRPGIGGRKKPPKSGRDGEIRGERPPASSHSVISLVFRPPDTFGS